MCWTEILQVGHRRNVQGQQGILQAGAVSQSIRARRETGNLCSFCIDEPDSSVRQLQRATMERIINCAAGKQNSSQFQGCSGGGWTPLGEPGCAVRTNVQCNFDTDCSRTEDQQSEEASRSLLCSEIEKTD